MEDTDYADPIVADLVDPARTAPSGEPCQSCGAPLQSDDTYCAACGSPNPKSTLSTTREAAAGGTDVDATPRQRFFQCKNCGSTVGTDPDQRSYVCAFCDSTYVVEFSPDETGRRAPDFIIGFSVTSEQALEKFRAWIKSNSWFRPGDLEHSTLDSKLVGVYLPFWSFSMLAQSNWSARIGEHWYRTETYTTTDSKGKTQTHTRVVQETEWWPLAGKHHRYYSGYLVSGSRSLNQDEAARIKPFQLPALQRYQSYYLAGWLCEEYSIAHDQALEVGQAVFQQQEYANVAAFMPGDTHRGLNVTTGFSHINSDLCLLPVYVWSYRYREKLYRFFVNGQTGKMAGEKPVSGKRITAFVALLLLFVAAIVLALYFVGAFQ